MLMLNKVESIKFKNIKGTFKNDTLKGWLFNNEIKGIAAEDLSKISKTLDMLNNSDMFGTIKTLFMAIKK